MTVDRYYPLFTLSYLCVCSFPFSFYLLVQPSAQNPTKAAAAASSVATVLSTHPTAEGEERPIAVLAMAEMMIDSTTIKGQTLEWEWIVRKKRNERRKKLWREWKRSLGIGMTQKTGRRHMLRERERERGYWSFFPLFFLSKTSYLFLLSYFSLTPNTLVPILNNSERVWRSVLTRKQGRKRENNG